MAATSSRNVGQLPGIRTVWTFCRQWGEFGVSTDQRSPRRRSGINGPGTDPNTAA